MTNTPQTDQPSTTALADRLHAVITRWYHLGMLRFSTRDDGSDDLLLRDELVRAVQAEARADTARPVEPPALADAERLELGTRLWNERGATIDTLLAQNEALRAALEGLAHAADTAADYLPEQPKRDLIRVLVVATDLLDELAQSSDTTALDRKPQGYFVTDTWNDGSPIEPRTNSDTSGGSQP